jgi:hypothetical protein
MSDMPVSPAVALLADGRVLIAGGTYGIDGSASRATLTTWTTVRRS